MRNLFLAVFISFLALFSIAASATPSKAQQPITIGAIYNLTGDQAPLDVPSALGAQLAVREINQQGGVLGQPLKLDIVNGQSQPSTIHSLARKFAKDKNIPIVFGLSDTNMVLAAAPVLADAHKLFITSGATSPNLPQQVPNYLFLACYTDAMQASTMAQFAYEKLNAKTAYVIANEDASYTLLLAQYFQQAFKQAGGQIIGYQVFKRDSVSINQQLQTLRKLAKSPAVILLATEPGESYNIIKQIRADGFQQPILGGDSFDSTVLFKQLGKLADNIYFTTHAFINPANENAQVQQFIAQYKHLYHQPPTSNFAALGYDTVKLIAAAITQAKSTNPDKIKQALYELKDWSGITGSIRYNNAPIPNKPVSVIKISNGKETLAYSQ